MNLIYYEIKSAKILFVTREYKTEVVYFLGESTFKLLVSRELEGVVRVDPLQCATGLGHCVLGLLAAAAAWHELGQY